MFDQADCHARMIPPLGRLRKSVKLLGCGTETGYRVWPTIALAEQDKDRQGNGDEPIPTTATRNQKSFAIVKSLPFTCRRPNLRQIMALALD